MEYIAKSNRPHLRSVASAIALAMVLACCADTSESQERQRSSNADVSLEIERLGVGDTALAQVLGSLRVLQVKTLQNGLRVKLMAYNPDPATCPDMGDDTDANCDRLLVATWLELGQATDYALWRVAKSENWSLVNVVERRNTEQYSQLLVRCAPVRPKKMESESEFRGVAYRLQVSFELRDDAQGIARPKYQATLTPLSSQELNGREFTCAGQPKTVP